MEYNEIRLRKPMYPVRPALEGYLVQHERHMRLPVHYEELMRYDGLMPQLDAKGKETLWNSVIYRPGELEDVHERLVEIYQELVADGRRIDHLKVASIDFCIYGNSQPFRIKILNQINDNHDYYYIKKADASRIYGLELEHLLSPNKINFIHDGETLVEEHIIGVPGDEFMAHPQTFGMNLNEVRLSKEFVKFNERCFVRLLGDMRAYNFVVVVTQDFDQVQYRLRSIDFDQQCYEGRSRIYLPQFYKDNLAFVQFAQRHMSQETADQYRNEERALLRKRYLLSRDQIEQLLTVMQADELSTPEHVQTLREDLAKFHGNEELRACTTMGDIVRKHISLRLELA